MSVTPHPKYKEMYIIVHYPYGRGLNPQTNKRENRKERIILGPCSFEEAKAYERELIRKSRNVTIHADPKICDIYVDFLADHKLEISERTLKDFESVWDNHLFKAFAHLRFSQLTPHVFTTFKTDRLATGIKHRTVNKILTHLSAIISWASKPERGYCNLNFKVPMFPAKFTEPPPKILPSQSEIDKMLQCLPNDNRGALCKIMYLAGLRIGDANKVTGKQVDLENGYMMILGKGNKYRMVPITKEISDLILPRMNESYLWPNPKTDRPFKSVRKTISTACKQAGITKHVTAHILRHCFGTHIQQKGAASSAAQKLLGHSSLKTTEKYTHHDPTFLRQEMNKLRDNQEELTSPQITDINIKKLDIPKDLLEELVWKIPTTLIARIYNVSDKAIEKRCKLYGIKKPPRGFWAKQVVHEP